MRIGIAAWAVISSLALGGCGILKTLETGGSEYWVRPGTTRPANEVEAGLMYFEYLKKLSGAELSKEHEQMKQGYAKNSSDFARIQLVLLLSMPNTRFKDEARAAHLLEPLLKDEDARKPGLKSFAFFLNAVISERKKLDDSLQSLSQQLKDEQKKLDALKTIEKSIIERERARPK